MKNIKEIQQQLIKDLDNSNYYIELKKMLRLELSKEIAIPMQIAKNDYLKWLENNNATDIKESHGGQLCYEKCDYQIEINAFINREHFSVWFNRKDEIFNIFTISCATPNVKEDLNLEEFIKLLDKWKRFAHTAER